MNKKKITIMATSLALVGVIGLGASLAYFTDQDQATNTITMGHVDIDLTEPNYPGGPNGGEIEDVNPGDEIVKDPTITVQTGSQNSYVRAQITITGLDQAHTDLLLEKNTDGTFKYLDIDVNDWTESTDGYFYYVGDAGNGKDGVLAAGQSVKLFENVKIPGSGWGNEMVGKSFSIIVKAEAIQAANFEPGTVNGVFGWFENGVSITPETYNANN